MKKENPPKITSVETQTEYLKAIKEGGIALAVLIIIVMWIMLIYTWFDWQMSWLL